MNSNLKRRIQEKRQQISEVVKSIPERKVQSSSWQKGWDKGWNKDGH